MAKKRRRSDRKKCQRVLGTRAFDRQWENHAPRRKLWYQWGTRRMRLYGPGKGRMPDYARVLHVTGDGYEWRRREDGLKTFADTFASGSSWLFDQAACGYRNTETGEFVSREVLLSKNNVLRSDFK